MEEEFFRKSASVGCLLSLQKEYSGKRGVRFATDTIDNEKKLDNQVQSNRKLWQYVLPVIIAIACVCIASFSSREFQVRRFPPGQDVSSVCLHLQEMQPINFDRFAGRWYQLAQLKVKSGSGEQPACVRADIKLDQADTQMSNILFTYARINFNNTAPLQEESIVGERSVDINVYTNSDTFNLRDQTIGTQKWRVLYTDYTNLAIIHSCQSLIAGKMSEYVFALGRSLEVDPMDMGDILHQFAKWELPYREVEFSPLDLCATVI